MITTAMLTGVEDAECCEWPGQAWLTRREESGTDDLTEEDLSLP